MTFKATILCENSVGTPFGVIGEHGFSCYIETEKSAYLFDTGQGSGIIPNSIALQKDLNKIDSVMISHGHYDHTGGLPAVLRLRGAVEVYGHPQMFIDRYWSDKKNTRHIGMPFRREYLESLGARFCLSSELVAVGPGVFLTGEIPRKNTFEKSDEKMTAHFPSGDKVHPDPILDDLSLILDSEKGLIIVLGCGHAGMMNIIDYAIDQMGNKKIFAVIGGTHLGFAGESQFTETLNALDNYDIEKIGVSHCTGLEKASILHSRLGDRFFFGCVGASVEV